MVYFKGCCFFYLPTNSFQHSNQNEIISRRPRRAHSSLPLPNGSPRSQAATRWREEGRMQSWRLRRKNMCVVERERERVSMRVVQLLVNQSRKDKPVLTEHEPLSLSFSLSLALPRSLSTCAAINFTGLDLWGHNFNHWTNYGNATDSSTSIYLLPKLNIQKCLRENGSFSHLIHKNSKITFSLPHYKFPY